MEISFESTGRRRILLAASLFIAAAVIFQAGELWLASHRLDSHNLDLMERGAALVPGDGSAWDRIGLLRQWDFVSSDLGGALADFQKAVHDDPLSAHYWMDVASAYEAAGDETRARDAFMHAKSVYPASAEVAFHYGNFLLREQKYPEAHAEFQQAVRADPTLLPLVISRTWRSSEDVNDLLNGVLPATPDAYLQAIDFLASIRQAQPALAVWQRLLKLSSPFPLPRTFPLFEDLIREDRAEDARRVWPEALGAAGLPHDSPANNSLIWDGNFKSDFENGGLGWRWTPLSGTSIDFDSDPAPNGSRAVRVDFNGGSNLALIEPAQFVPVEPNHSYHFHAYMRTQEITTESGMRFSITDANRLAALNLITENFTGTRSWTPVDLDLATGPATHFLLVRLVRGPSSLFDNKLSGTVWIADVSLIPAGANGAALEMKALRIGLCMLLAFSVLALGAVEVWSLSILEIGAAVLFLFWAVLTYQDAGAKIEWSPLNWPLLGFLGIGFLQLVFHGTAYPFHTRTELLKLAAYFLVFFLLTQAFRKRKDLTGLAWFVILFCFAVSLLGIIQHFTSGNEIYWLDALKLEGEPFGPYVNRNHFAGFVELTLPMGLALMAFRGVRGNLFPLTTLLTIVPISAIVLSGSRGGIISFGFEVGILALLVRSKRALQGRRAMGIVIVALAAVALIAWIGVGRAVEKFSSLKAQDVSSSRRASMVRGAAGIFLDHPIKGSGLGTLVDVYPRYETAYDGRVVDHVHNDYAETLAETGLLGGLCGAILLWLLYREARKSFVAEQAHFSQGLHAGAIVAVSGLLLHSFVDFNLQIPSNALLFLLQAFLATSPALPSDARRKEQGD